MCLYRASPSDVNDQATTGPSQPMTPTRPNPRSLFGSSSASKKSDEARRNHQELSKCLGLKVLARRGDTFRTAQVQEVKDDGAVGVMMAGDTNLTFFSEPMGDLCMVSKSK